MRKNRLFKIRFLADFVFVFILFACTSNENVDPLNKALESEAVQIKKVMNTIEQHEVQILFSEVLKDAKGSVTFKEYSFQNNDALYFYPASTVKFPIAVLALEKLNEQKVFNRSSKFYVEGDTLESSFADDIVKIFAVSDNAAYNRLFEYLGKDDINKRLISKGIKGRISHRLSVENSDALVTKPLIFYLNDSTSTPTEEIHNTSIEPLELDRIEKGVGYMEGDSLIQKPKDFSEKNYLPISSLHAMMKRLIFPEHFSEVGQFHLSESDREFILNAMRILPREAGYDPSNYYDGYVKFFVMGDTKDRMPEQLEIYNKVGYAYGYLTDCAYIKNKETGREFILTATIHVNENQIFNDDNYEYESIGIPFLAELGRQLVLK